MITPLPEAANLPANLPPYPPANLPATLERPCCPGNPDCGTTTLRLGAKAELWHTSDGPVLHVWFGYYRDNGYAYREAETLQELAEWVSHA